jgi:hypothetical protein
MAPIRRSNRVPKPRDYWDPTNSPSHQRHSLVFIIYTESSEHLSTHSEHLEYPTEDLTEDLTEGLIEGLSTEFSDKDLSFELSDEDLSPELDEDLSPELDEDLSLELDEDLSLKLNKDLSKHLTRQLHEDLDMNLLYQPQFLSKDRAGKSQNLFKDSDSLKLFQLFFSVKEIENIVEQINQQAAYIDFKHLWKPLTVTEIYHYLECLVYMRIQPL